MLNFLCDLVRQVIAIRDSFIVAAAIADSNHFGHCDELGGV